MSQISEVKCPSCGTWSKWTGEAGETCPHCNARFNPGRYEYEQERKIITERNKHGLMVINKDDDPLVQMFKQFVNWLRWTTFYGISIIWFIIAFIVVLYGLLML